MKISRTLGKRLLHSENASGLRKGVRSLKTGQNHRNRRREGAGRAELATRAYSIAWKTAAHRRWVYVGAARRAPRTLWSTSPAEQGSGRPVLQPGPGQAHGFVQLSLQLLLG